jgi:hypothetical protein
LDLTAGDDEPDDAPAPVLHADPRRSAVYQLADAGESALAIAEQTELTLGEVELMLALRKTRASA